MNRALAWIFGGLGATLALRAWDPFAATVPLAGTFTVLPLVTGLFAAAHRTSARAPDERFGVLRLAAAFGLLLLASARVELGFRYGDVLGASVIFASLVGLLAWQTHDSLRIVGGASRRARPLAFFLVVLAVYAGIAPWTSEQRPPDGDEPYYLLLAHSLAYDRDADLANNYAQGDSLAFMPRAVHPQPGDPIGPGGEQFSRHNVLLPVVLAPFYRIAGLAGALAVMALLAAALATLVFRIAELYFPEHPSANLVAASVTAFAPPLLLQSNQVWVEVPAALLVAVGFEAAARLEIAPKRRLEALKVFGAILLLPFLKLRFLALAFPILAIAIARSPRSSRAILLRGLALLLAVAAAIMLFNQASFGQALKHHSTASLLSYLTSPADYLAGPLGLLFDSSFGLFFTAPIWVLTLPGAWAIFRRRRALFAEAALICTPYLLLLGPRSEWYGGWSPFFRYGMVFLPVLALFLIPALARRSKKGAGFLIATLATATACLTLLWLVLPGWTYNFADGRGYLLDHLTTTVGTDMARLFPSQVRPRVANLIWPILALGISGLAFQWRRKPAVASFSAGVTTLLMMSAVLVTLGAALPTRIVEFEDPYVEKHGGELWPDRWTPSRVAYRGSWLLGPGDRLALRVRPAGTELALAIDFRPTGAISATTKLEVLADQEHVLMISLPESQGWSTLQLDPISWPEDTVTLGLGLAGANGKVLLDRAHLEWR